jgi:MFS family permease
MPSPYVADNYGRKTAIVAGCVFMIAGGALSAFADGYWRKLPNQLADLARTVPLNMANPPA